MGIAPVCDIFDLCEMDKQNFQAKFWTSRSLHDNLLFCYSLFPVTIWPILCSTTLHMVCNTVNLTTGRLRPKQHFQLIPFTHDFLADKFAESSSLTLISGEVRLVFYWSHVACDFCYNYITSNVSESDGFRGSMDHHTICSFGNVVYTLCQSQHYLPTTSSLHVSNDHTDVFIHFFVSMVQTLIPMACASQNMAPTQIAFCKNLVFGLVLRLGEWHGGWTFIMTISCSDLDESAR
jgi:hypothetical protein